MFNRGFGLAAGLAALAMLVPGPARACTCMSPRTWVLPEDGAQDVPTLSRVFLHWFTDLGTFRLMKADAEVPVDRVDGPAYTDWPAPRFRWLVPRSPLEPWATYRVELESAQGGTVSILSEFTTGGDPAGMVGNPLEDVTAVLAFYEGNRDNNGGSCGGIDAVHVGWSVIPGNGGVSRDSVIDVFVWKQGDDPPDSPVLEVPLAGYPTGVSVGWVSLCEFGLRLPLEECEVHCAAVQARNLSGASTARVQAGCVRLSWLTPAFDEALPSCAVVADAAGTADEPAGADVATPGDLPPGDDARETVPSRSSGCQAGAGDAGAAGACATILPGLAWLLRRRRGAPAKAR